MQLYKSKNSYQIERKNLVHKSLIQKYSYIIVCSSNVKIGFLGNEQKDKCSRYKNADKMDV